MPLASSTKPKPLSDLNHLTIASIAGSFETGERAIGKPPPPKGDLAAADWAAGNRNYRGRRRRTHVSSAPGNPYLCSCYLLVSAKNGKTAMPYAKCPYITPRRPSGRQSGYEGDVPVECHIVPRRKTAPFGRVVFSVWIPRGTQKPPENRGTEARRSPLCFRLQTNLENPRGPRLLATRKGGAGASRAKADRLSKRVMLAP